VASGGSGSSREYIWLDDRAVGYVTFNSSGVPSLQYLTTGQIDEPLVLTNSAKTVTWNGYTDPFGLGATFGTPSAILNLRLPGQLYQSETSAAGLSLNGARNYDPTLGRYTQPDPLGIDAGANPYAYVDGDPLNLTDPSGLATLQLGGAGSVNIPLGPIGISIPLGVGIAVDTGGHVGVYGYWGGGVQIGAEAEAGLSIQVSNAQTICDLGGPFANFSGHAGLGFGGSADFFSGSSQHGPVYGGGVTLGAAAGASLSAAVTNTTVKPIW
jgi:RHS repeat-associated protein